MEAIPEKARRHPKEASSGKPRSLLDLTEAALKSLSLVRSTKGAHDTDVSEGGRDGEGGTSSSSPAAMPTVRDKRLKKREDGEEDTPEETLTCKTAPGVVFASRGELAEHCWGDWHRYNLKMIALGRPLVDEDGFEAMVDDLSSLSGSDSESNVDEDELALERLFRAQHASLRGASRDLDDDDDDDDSSSIRAQGSTPFVRVEGAGIGRFRLFSCLLPPGAAKGDAGSGIQLPEIGSALSALPTSKMTLLFASGGHFAGCIFEGRNQIKHKTFHRYVIRAKAGTRQLTRDAMGGGSVPKSAGSSIRRYNEAALQRDINDLLESWRADINASCIIFVHAPGTINRSSLFGSGVVSSKDPRVRSVPFPIRRPTLSEVSRVHSVLTQMHDDAADIVPPLSRAVKETRVKAVMEEASEEEEEGEVERADPMFSMCAKSQMPEIKRHLAVGGLVDPVNDIGRTPLHLAALNGPARIVGFLLDICADPTIKDDSGKVPYALSKGKEERDAFRRFMAANPDKWDYNLAAVPCGLTSEMEEEQERKAAEKREKERARKKEQERRKKEAERKKKEEQDEAATATKATAGMTDRERRAMAAEKRLGGVVTLSPIFNCEMCKKTSQGGAPFERLGFKYCSTACVVDHKKVLCK